MSHKNKHECATPGAPAGEEVPPREAEADAAPVAEAQPEPAAPAAEATPEANPLAEEVALLKDRLARSMADFDNYRKRQLREREETVRRANENLLEDLLPFLDTLDIALANGNTDDPFAKGVRMAANQLHGILSKNGMAEVEAAGAFNPNVHEALAHAPSDAVPEGGILRQTRRGWTLNGRLLRAAQVIVSSGGVPLPSESEQK